LLQISPQPLEQYLCLLRVQSLSQLVHSAQGLGQLCIVVGVGCVGVGTGVGVGAGVGATVVVVVTQFVRFLQTSPSGRHSHS